MQNGKGDNYRPVNKKLFDENFDKIEKMISKVGEFKQVKVKGKNVWRKVYK